MIQYNILIWGARQPTGSLDGIGSLDLPVTHRYPISGRSPRRRLPLAVSGLLHIAIIGSAMIWLHREPLPPATPETAIEIEFQAPRSDAAAPSTPAVQAAPAPTELPPPQRPQAAAPAPSVPPPPPVEQAEPAPSAPTPPLPLEEQQTPALPPLPVPPVPPPSPEVQPPKPVPRQPPPRPQSRAPVRPQPQSVQPAPPATETSQPPAATAPAPPAPISANWQQALAAWLAAHKYYPEEARRREQQGTVTLRFTVERSGRVLDVAVVHSSGSAILDRAAEAMLHSATLPAFPATMSQTEVAVSVQVRYALTE